MIIKDWREVVRENFPGDSDNDPSRWVKYNKDAPLIVLMRGWREEKENRVIV